MGTQIPYLRWTRWSAMVGSIVWTALVGASAGDLVAIGTIEILFLLAPLVIVPLGLLLAALPNETGVSGLVYHAAYFLQPFAAALVITSFWFPVGIFAALCASAWLLVSVFIALSGLSRILRRGFRPAEEACVDAGLLLLPIGGVSIVLSRLGVSPLGYAEPIVILTAVHFHYAGFTAPLFAGMTGRAIGDPFPLAYALFRFVALGVIAGPPLLATGFVLYAPLLKIVAALLSVISLIGLSLLVIFMLHRIRHHLAQILLAVSVGSLIVGMVFAATYAVGEFTGHLPISIPQMVRIHGIANGLGFSLCGLLGWILVHPGARWVRGERL